MSTIAIIAALGAKTRAIGKENGLLWSVREDMVRFKELTTGHPVIMGRKTWESIPEKFRPLPGRTNIVITRNARYAAPEAILCSTLDEALSKASQSPGSDETFVIGGGEIYAQALPRADTLYLTLVHSDLAGDAFFPEYDLRQFSSQERLFRSTETGLEYELCTFRRR